MGKAIVIDGLQVINPLCTVTFSGTPAENALRAYLAANTSINTTEEEALTTFVGALIDANLWDKMSYFYPLLGNNLTDALLEVVSPSTEDLFVNNTAGLSVSSRKLFSNDRQQSEITFAPGSKIRGIEIYNIGMVLAGSAETTTSGAGQGTNFFMNNGTASNTGFALQTSYDTYRYPTFSYNGTSINNPPSDIYPRVKREVFGTINSGVGYLYDGTTQLATNNVTVPTTGYIQSSYGVLRNQRTFDYEYDFFAITNGMTPADWLVFHPLLMTFLQAVGKRSS